MILAVRTDKPEAELYVYDNSGKSLDKEAWQAHRMLGETILSRIETLLTRNGLALSDLNGVVFFSGPGSFTGLRIGASVANALANSYSIPVVGSGGEEWISDGIEQLDQNPTSEPVVPVYGSAPHITQQKR